MKRLTATLPNIFLSLTGICLVAGVALSAANKYTATAIEASKAAALKSAIENVTPEFDNNPMDEKTEVKTDEGTVTIYPAKKGGDVVGAAVETFTKKGFGGTVRIMAGFDAEGKIVNYTVLEHSETPGLGSKMGEWFANAEKPGQCVVGRKADGQMKVVKDGGDVDAITAATISSRAFLDAVNRAYNAYKGNDATTGATTQATGQN